MLGKARRFRAGPFVLKRPLSALHLVALDYVLRAVVDGFHRIVAGDQDAALKALRDFADIIFLTLQGVNLAFGDKLAAALDTD